LESKIDAAVTPITSVYSPPLPPSPRSSTPYHQNFFYKNGLVQYLISFQKEPV